MVLGRDSGLIFAQTTAESQSCRIRRELHAYQGTVNTRSLDGIGSLAQYTTRAHDAGKCDIVTLDEAGKCDSNRRVHNCWECNIRQLMKLTHRFSCEIHHPSIYSGI